MDVVIISKTGGQVEEERASLFHLNREQLRAKRMNIIKLKFYAVQPEEETILENKKEIEEQILNFFRPLFCGRHDRNGIDTGVEFVQGESFWDELLEGLGTLSKEDIELL